MLEWRGIAVRGAVSGIALISGTIAAPSAAEPAAATVENGRLAGLTETGVERFLGIPFAAPPVGDLRWRAPQPVEDWQGIRDAKEHGFDCEQAPVPGIAAPLGAPLSEDCLYLNVWKPAEVAPGEKLPVMVWIHGGGFVNGGASPEVFDGRYFARNDIVVVGVNYRLGRFGFFAHPALTAENSDDGFLGNYGLMDQVAALQWVKRNIAAFGGDPERITIFGESAGGMSVNFLLTSPLSRDLIDGAIVQSGGGRGNIAGEIRVRQSAPGDGSLEATGLAFAQAHGIDGTGPAALEQLRALPANEIVGGLNMFNMARQSATYGGPAIDGRLVVEYPDVAFAAGRWSNVPVMVGATSDDIGSFPASIPAEAWEKFGDRSGAAQEAFAAEEADQQQVMKSLGQVWGMIEPARWIAETISAQGTPAYAFRFGYVAESERAPSVRGARHASDVPFAMGTVTERYGAKATDADIAMGQAMNAYWGNFARTGDPNGPGLPAWPRYSPQDDLIMHLGPNDLPATGEDPRKQQLDLVAYARSLLSRQSD